MTSEPDNQHADRTPHSDVCDDLDALLDGIGLHLARPTAPAVDRATLERWGRHAGRALLYLTENQP